MRYALNLADDGRVLSATFEPYASPDMPLVQALPEGSLPDYLYRGGVFVHDPLPVPVPEEREPTAQEDAEAMLIDHEYRLTLLELGLAEE